jgi:hypothetical protein
LVTLCYVLTDDEEREECIARVLKLPASKRFVGPMCPPPEPQQIMTANLENLGGDPISSAGMGERKYSYFKTAAYLITGFFLGGASDLKDMLGVVGGTYRSELGAQVTVYENGTFTDLRETYDATNLSGARIGVQVSVARQLSVSANDGTVFALNPFEPVSAGDTGVTNMKSVWMSARYHRYPDEARMRVVMHAENSLPLGPAGYGVGYSLGLLP